MHPPPSVREVWYYEYANIEFIRRSINELNWEKVFLNTSVNVKVDVFNSTILDNLSNFIPHEFVVCNYKDPSWLKKNKNINPIKKCCT